MTQAPAAEATTSAEALARKFHEAYEALAPEHGYETREASAKPWDEVPEQNRALMIATVQKLINDNAFVMPPSWWSPDTPAELVRRGEQSETVAVDVSAGEPLRIIVPIEASLDGGHIRTQVGTMVVEMPDSACLDPTVLHLGGNTYISDQADPNGEIRRAVDKALHGNLIAAPITAFEAAAQSAACLRKAVATPGAHDIASIYLGAAEHYRNLALAIATHASMTPPEKEDTRR